MFNGSKSDQLPAGGGIAPSSPASSPDEIYRLVREAAYLKAEARNFAPGVELQDWLEAEREVLATLGRKPAQL